MYPARLSAAIGTASRPARSPRPHLDPRALIDNLLDDERRKPGKNRTHKHIYITHDSSWSILTLRYRPNCDRAGPFHADDRQKSSWVPSGRALRSNSADLVLAEGAEPLQVFHRMVPCYAWNLVEHVTP